MPRAACWHCTGISGRAAFGARPGGVEDEWEGRRDVPPSPDRPGSRYAGRACQFLGPAAERIGVKVRITPWTEAPAHLGAELVISALPPGAADELAPFWKPTAGTLMDVLYRPWPTPLAHAAATAGRWVIGGLPMLVHQAARQVALQTKCPRPPYEDMLTAASAVVHQLDTMT